MKVITKIEQATAENRPFWSFEYFPPKTQQGINNLYDRMERMYKLGPTFIDVTWGAGGSTSDLTLELCDTAQSVYGLETTMHLTCTNMPKEQIDFALKKAKECGIQNILALRGDPPRGQEVWTACESGFSNAVDLVRYIREQYGDYFCVSVAGYPEGHLDATSFEEDLRFLKEKVDAGADYIVTQLFYDVELFLEWVKKCREIGIQCPILPGILPIQNYNGFKRMTTLCKTFVPQAILDELEPIKEDDQAVKDYGVRLAISMCRRMQEEGILGFHFYTLNLERSTRLVLEGLNFVPAQETVRPLPWNPSLSKKRANENVRPIFWRNRVKSYIARTENWDDFPNGRWGDSRSPAYGNLGVHGVSLKQSMKEAKQLWKSPQNLSEICQLFADYCSGKVLALPWSDQPLLPESGAITEKLVNINRLGYLTINSQPAVNGVESSHKVHGWGPQNGYVYQKAYLEFFVSPEALDRLVHKINQDPYITYYAINKQGDLRTNTQSDEPNAVTWGIFPGKQIVQPTIVEAYSFTVWKDEAFELWGEWAKVYEPEEPTRQCIESIMDNWYLVNVVHNDYQDADAIFKIFDIEDEQQ
ncbi:methylenetetrahydrofolate reduct [Basidiobolus meristosporus CBS 931.73]|uniref:methylenetetrahydrofolate reductase (NADH) n=1 Tax=Basidiobolus meristosporus CBS 931.73 TaxID=1314790 RepID=A0A1Y1XT89_9FUNG|nr:methylenetetrahydrofolate reduct [Basidiobolus meristosporus CBS 931.73]|eukprot:ORX88979.1 methylenetetrahydrofolate reduct [Basidiobolus meristosporus CBS 931.73]